MVIDLGWTRQKLILPKARELIHPEGQIVTLIKPQYEAPREWLKGGTLTEDQAAAVMGEVVGAIPQVAGFRLWTPLRVQFGARGAMWEYLALLKRV